MEGTNEAAEPAVVGRACLPMERTDEPTVYTSSSPGIEELVWKARRLASERRRDMERRFEDVVEDQLDNVFPPDFIPKRDTEHDAQRSREGQVATLVWLGSRDLTLAASLTSAPLQRCRLTWLPP